MRQPIEQQTRLLRIHAQLAGLIGLLFSDLGRRNEMRRWFHTAQMAADESGDRALRAWVLAKEAKAEMENDGLPEYVLRQAQHADAVAGNAPSPPKLIAITIQAPPLGMQGRTREVTRLTGQALDLFAKLETVHTDNSVYAMSEQQLHLYIANALRQSGGAHESLDHYRRALALFPADEPLDPVLTRIDEATGLVQADEIYKGCQKVVRELVAFPALSPPPLLLTLAQETPPPIPPT